ncbi:efflux RND transporter periplasmic adaptor subunit [Hymenobacter cheonanensis]|uniref:efflux RND transporter periplasmic adaptor subunit n=1 Tax=Hymenobacter sp. CA2-7 TaxID=3063993 RepID=UPI002712A25B|nr:efflux RND transporter periplasmic adaptor subunit [Hymenobacter sp. CA2-7]MDO7883870.1 efflux RND transporter periplasmic adaptor subunit [Hymenobacter sp. CA2-7]
MKSFPKTPFRLLVAAMLAAPVVSLTACGGDKKNELPTNTKDTESTYRTDTVKSRNLAQDLRFTGKVSYDQRRVDQVFPVVSGNVLAVNAALGQHVSQGQALATVQSADVSGYLNDFNAAKSDYALAKRTADNTEQLYKTNFASQQDLIAAREGLAKAQSSLNRTQQVLKLYGAGTGSTAQPVYQVKAPVSGYVVARNINPNMQLRPDNSTPLFTISDLSRVWILVNVYETDVEDVKVGEQVTISALAYPDKQFTGTITNISNVVDADTRVLQARVELPNPDGLLKPDMFCTVSLHLEDSGQGLAVNPKSVIFSQDKYFVVKQDGPGKYRVVPVKVVRTTSQYSYVTGDLKNGDQVVTEGSLLLFNDLTD